MSPIPDATRTQGLKRKEQGLSTLLLYVTIVCRRGALPCDTVVAAGSTQTPSLRLPLWAASKAEISLDSGCLPPVSAALTYPMESTSSRWAAICHRHHAPCGKKIRQPKLLRMLFIRPSAVTSGGNLARSRNEVRARRLFRGGPLPRVTWRGIATRSIPRYQRRQQALNVPEMVNAPHLQPY